MSTPISAPQTTHFLEIAEALKPELKRTRQAPLSLVTVEKDESQLLGWKTTPAGSLEDMLPIGKGESVVIDFGGHRAGFFSFTVVAVQHGIEPADAPARIRLVYGEILNDVAEDFEPYNAWLSKSWLPEETINVDFMPEHVEMSRRQAFRYVKLEVIDTSLRYKVKFENCFATAVSSAPLENPPILSFSSHPEISEDDRQALRRIDEVAHHTLRSCMHTVFEDGPRRDRRLWIGDLRLQALASYSTFKDFDLAKRCLYLFAAMPYNDAGLLPACLYESKEPHAGGNAIVDYSLLFGVSLLDYVKASGDKEAGRELWPSALKQFELLMDRVGEDFVYAIHPGQGEVGGMWTFIDWQESLNKSTSIHSVFLFGLRAMSELAKLLDLPTTSLQPPNAPTPLCLDEFAHQMTLAARKHFYDADMKVFVSGPDRQVSWASQAWSVLAGVPETQQQAAEALKRAYEDDQTVIGNTPYAHHYLCEAFILAGLSDLAVQHIKTYWGSMVNAGAETFFEGWDPKHPRFSPYGDLHSNSFCHAWSCTPSLLLRQLGFA